MTAAPRVDELRARRAARAAERAAFEARRQYGLQTRHAAKLARLAALVAEKEHTEAPENVTPPPDSEPDVA